MSGLIRLLPQRRLLRSLEQTMEANPATLKVVHARFRNHQHSEWKNSPPWEQTLVDIYPSRMSQPSCIPRAINKLTLQNHLCKGVCLTRMRIDRETILAYPGCASRFGSALVHVRKDHPLWFVRQREHSVFLPLGHLTYSGIAQLHRQRKECKNNFYSVEELKINYHFSGDTSTLGILSLPILTRTCFSVELISDYP